MKFKYNKYQKYQIISTVHREMMNVVYWIHLFLVSNLILEIIY